jgi:uncharacterized protein YegL
MSQYLKNTYIYIFFLKYLMGGGKVHGSSGTGSGNANLYTESIKEGQLPSASALPYEGLINESHFTIQKPEQDKLLSLELSSALVNSPLSDDPSQDIFVGVMLKSKFDGIGNKNLPIDIVIVLDVSGSMDSRLGESTESCLSLAKTAIRKVCTRMSQEDRLGLCTFNNKGKTIFELSHREEIAAFEDNLDKIVADGGTVLYNGLWEGYDLMTREFYPKVGMEIDRMRRILFLTDLQSCDETKFIELLKKSSEENIFTTIIGIGLNFNSSFAEIASKNKGTSYFSATKPEHLDKIIVENFNYTFFPIAFDVSLEFRSGDLQMLKCIGSNQKVKEKNYSDQEWSFKTHQLSEETFRQNVNFLLLFFNRMKKKLPKAVLANTCNFLRYHKKTIAEINTCISSPFKNIGDELKMQGGIFLLKLKAGSCSREKSGSVTLRYKNSENKCFSESYYFNFKVNELKLDGKMNYFSHSSVREGICVYYFAKMMRKILKIYNKEKKNYVDRKIFFTKENIKKEIENISNFLECYYKELNEFKYKEFATRFNEVFVIIKAAFFPDNQVEV